MEASIECCHEEDESHRERVYDVDTMSCKPIVVVPFVERLASFVTERNNELVVDAIHESERDIQQPVEPVWNAYAESP